MAKPDLSHLDKDALTQFRTNDVDGIAAFKTKIAALTETVFTPGGTTTVVELANALEKPNVPYSELVPKFGKLGAGDSKSPLPIDGGQLSAYMLACAKSLSTVMQNQATLFTNIDKELGDTIAEMERGKEKSLEDIKGQEFLVDWKSVDQVFQTKPPSDPSKP